MRAVCLFLCFCMVLSVRPEASLAQETATETDHDIVVGRLGITGLATGEMTLGADAKLVTSIVGARYWLDQGIGFEAGIGVTIDHVATDGDDRTHAGFGMGGGMLLTLGSYKHITTFAEPYIDFFVFSPDDGDTQFLMHILGSVGFEWHFGFDLLDTPTLALIVKVGLGMMVHDVGNATSFALESSGLSFQGLANVTGGLVFYL